ncbi:MAG: cation diffusion facilitator family transporter [Nanohaloarchaea archaeon]|nr:cation diffusion facilitator family transporter [Candidatus Nanohaloarchaea archaeon]
MKEKIAKISVFANLILAVGKILVGIITNSSAILAEGIHSGMDVFSSGISFIGIRMSKKPKDKEHPYGHYKFEVLTGLIITLILFMTGIGIIYGSYKSFLDPTQIMITYLALGIMLFSAIVNEIMARLKIHYGKSENSLSLLSDGYHSRIDVYASLAVLIGLVLSKYWIYVDSILAFLIGLYIIKESFSLGKEATDSLLDVSAGDDIELEIRQIVKDEGIELSSLKTQKKGSAVTANIEIKLPDRLTVGAATDKSNRLRDELIKRVDILEYIAIQIKSYEISSGFYRSYFGRGFRWNRQGKSQEEIKITGRLGSGGTCICPRCGHEQPHIRGQPCNQTRCPKCDTLLTRKE